MKRKNIVELQRIIWQYLKPGETKAFIFGSQATNKAWRGSDVDLGIEGEVTQNQLIKLREAIENSTIPFTVDVVNFNQMNQDFVKTAKAKTIPL